MHTRGTIILMKAPHAGKAIMGAVFGLFIASLVIYFSLVSSPTKAQTTVPSGALNGYAWSSNIGWIDMNGVTVDSTGNISGYAWSSNVGWVSFNQTDLGGCPAGGSGCTATMNLSGLSGWARVCTGTTNKDCQSAGRTDGFDGWISLDGVTFDGGTKTFGGYAWGSNVVGWVDFSGVTFGAAVVPPGTPDGFTVETGSDCGKVNMHWNAVSGATGYYVYSKSSAAGSVLVKNGPIYSASGIVDYTFTGIGGTNYSFYVTSFVTSGGVATESIPSVTKSATTNGTCEGVTTITCPDGSVIPSTSVCPVVVPPPEINSFSMSPGIVNKNDSCKMVWVVTNASACNITGAGYSSPFDVDISSRNSLTPPITHTASYKMTCQNSKGVSVSKSAVCSMNPNVTEF